MLRYAFVSLSALLLSSCVIADKDLHQDQTDVLTPSKLNARRDEYDGKRVIVRGYLQLGYEERYLLDNKRNIENWSNDACITMGNAGPLLGSKSVYNKKYVEIAGVFRKNILKDLIQLGACNVTGLEFDPSFEPQVLK